MKIALVVRPMLTRRPFHVLKQIESVLKEQSKNAYDLLLFPQAYLQGIYGIDYQLEAALKTALFVDSKPIKKLQELCKKYLIGVGFGFYEKDENYAIYDSYLIINRMGTLRHLQRQLTVHWLDTAPELPEIYQADGESDNSKELLALTADFFDSDAELPTNDGEAVLHEEAEGSFNDIGNLNLENAVGFSRGTGLKVGYFGGKRILILLGDDFMQNEIITAALELEPQLVVCPTALAHNETEWREQIFERYQQRARKFNCPVLVVNALNRHDEFVKGGAWIWQGQRQLQTLPFNEEGILSLELE